jgi:hypothetical protein
MSIRFRPFVWCLTIGLAIPLAAQQRPPLDAPVVVGHSGIRMVKTLDVDGNGWIDAVGWWPMSTSAQRMYAMINDGAGKLVPTFWLDFPTTGEPVVDPHDACDTGDLNQDGRDDFVFSNRSEVRVYLSNGAAAPTLFVALPYPTTVYVNANGTLQIRSFDFASSTSPIVSELVTSYRPDGRLVAAELTGDATPDLLVGGTRIYPVVAGTIQVPTIFPEGWAYDPAASLRPDVGDIDGDHDLDVVTFRVHPSDPAQYRVLRRTGASSFVAEAPRLGGPARRLFDLDGDGDLDGTCCGGGGSDDGNSAISKFRLSYNDGTGNFAPSLDMPGLGSTAIAGVADVDHDGHVDLVAGRCVYYASGPITTTPVTSIANPQHERSIHDFDMEGDPDFDVSWRGAQVNLGDGSQVWRPHTLPPAPNGLERIGYGMPGDWDGDGAVDLLVMLVDDFYVPAGLELLRNLGGGAFESKGVVAGPAGLRGGPHGDLMYPTSTRDSLAEDLDGDGDLDLVLRTRSDTLLNINLKWSCWLRNDGAAGFAFVEDFANTVILDAADINGDGIVDLFGVEAVGPQPWLERWAPGLGGGAWGPWVEIPGTSVRPCRPADQVQIVDVDGDGDLDLVHTWSRSDGGGLSLRGRLHLNDGAGNFVMDPTVDVSLNATSSRSGAALAVDLNSDNLVDLMFGTTGTGQAGILLRKPDNSGWEPQIDQVVFEDQTDPCLTTRDPDGDRDNDVITNWLLIKNRTFEGTQGGARHQDQTGQAGQGGIVPVLGASGPFRVGQTTRLRLRGGKPGTTGELVMSSATWLPATMGGQGRIDAGRRLIQYVPLTTSGSPSEPAGSGAWLDTFRVPAIFAGRTFRYEVVLDDAAGPNGRSTSNALLLTFGW